MKSITDDLRKLCYDIGQPDHTAAWDVQALRECYNALRALQTRTLGAAVDRQVNRINTEEMRTLNKREFEKEMEQ